MENTSSYLQHTLGTLQEQGKVIAITSGKGGVGKSNIAANLGICLASMQKKVILFDADMSLGNLDLIMDISCRYNISHFFSGRKSIEEIIHIGPEGLGVICGASGLEELANMGEFQMQRMLKEFSELQANADIILVDTAGGISKSVVSFCLASDHVLVVTTPEATAITDAYAMIKVLVKNEFRGKISLVVNMAETIAEGRRTFHQIANVVRRFLNTDLYDAGVLLKDSHISTSIRMRKPVVLAYPNAQISSALMALAVKLGRTQITKCHDETFLRKVVDWFF